MSCILGETMLSARMPNTASKRGSTFLLGGINEIETGRRRPDFPLPEQEAARAPFSAMNAALASAPRAASSLPEKTTWASRKIFPGEQRPEPLA